jgi:hypothetical protein
MINWDRDGGGDLIKFVKANETKREKNIRKINNFLGLSKNIWGDHHIFFILFSLLFPLLSSQ